MDFLSFIMDELQNWNIKTGQACFLKWILFIFKIKKNTEIHQYETSIVLYHHQCFVKLRVVKAYCGWSSQLGKYLQMKGQNNNLL